MGAAPAWRATCRCRLPIGPAPRISTDSPSRSRLRFTARTMHDTGSVSAASSIGVVSATGTIWLAGTRTYSARPPSTWMPICTIAGQFMISFLRQ